MKGRVCAVVLAVSLSLVGVALVTVPSFRRVAIQRPMETARHRENLQGCNHLGNDPIDPSFDNCGSHVRNSSAVAEKAKHLTFTRLTPQQIAGVKQFVLFIGYPGSGHSIIGSLMDAHPQMVISHEFSVLVQLARNPQLATKSELFNAIYRNSYNSFVKGWRSIENTRKGYTLGTGSKWQAGFTDLKVIGDKSGGTTTRFFHHSPNDFDRSYQNLMEMVRIPVSFVHVVRNPYDMAATDMLYHLSHEVHGVKYADVNTTHRYNDTRMLRRYFNRIATRAKANEELIRRYGMLVLEVHNSEFVLEPTATCRKICAFVGVTCPDSYLQECSDKAFKEVSRTRNLVVWSEDLVGDVHELIQKYPIFHRYSFDSN